MDGMDGIQKLIEQYGLGSTVVLFIIFVCACFGAIDLYRKGKGYLDDYHTTRNDIENKEKTVNERLERLEKYEGEDKERLDKISTSLDELRVLIQQVQKNQNHANIATCRSAMYRLGSELVKKGWATENESETLQDLYNVYVTAGAKDKPNVVERALLLPVLTDDEIRERLEGMQN